LSKCPKLCLGRREAIPLPTTVSAGVSTGMEFAALAPQRGTPRHRLHPAKALILRNRKPWDCQVVPTVTVKPLEEASVGGIGADSLTKISSARCPGGFGARVGDNSWPSTCNSGGSFGTPRSAALANGPRCWVRATTASANRLRSTGQSAQPAAGNSSGSCPRTA